MYGLCLGAGGSRQISPIKYLKGSWSTVLEKPPSPLQRRVCCGGAVVEDTRLPPDPDKEQVGRIPPVPTKKDAGSAGADDYLLNTCGAIHPLPTRTKQGAEKRQVSFSFILHTNPRRNFGIMQPAYQLPVACYFISLR